MITAIRFKKLLYIIIITFPFACSHENERDLIYWSSNNTQEIEFARYVTEGWNRNNPSDIIRFQPVPEGQTSEEVILAAVVGETTPSLYSNMWQGDVEAYAQAGVLVALDTMENFKEFLYSRCDSITISEIVSEDGHIYQIPWKINPIMLIYNKAHIKEAGFDNAPQTYSEFLQAAETFKKDLNGDGYVDQWIGYSEVQVTWWQRLFDFYPHYLAASGGAPLIKDNQAAFNNQYAVDVFRYLGKLYKNNYFSKDRLSAQQDPFLSGTIATRFTGPWEISHAEKFKPEGFEYAFDAIPVPDNHIGPKYTYGDPKSMVIFKTCPKPARAWEFVKYFMSPESDLKLVELSNQLPRRKELLQNELFNSYFNTNPGMSNFALQSAFIRGTDTSPVLKEVFDIISQEYEACVVYGIKSPEEAIKEAAESVNLLFLNKRSK